ncbi:MAG TPA: hypothetical protein VM866_04320 [Pyrinomonadaceae bacterium]|jgi:hypothetical protein|nr:hypothetical protein [Pyrinomonadaceae bacterium]
MRTLPIASFFVLLVGAVCSPPSAHLAAYRIGEPHPAAHDLPSPHNELMAQGGAPSFVVAYHGIENAYSPAEKPSADNQGGGIKEVVPKKFAARYREWKDEFLSTETGRKQWAMYEQDAKFTLTITVTPDRAQGAGTGKYAWDESGKLIAATITLGSRINEGYPNPVYYPVMNSLTPSASSEVVDGDVLAATKMAHEFGHLTRTAGADTTAYQLQCQLMPVYNKILLSNGRNTDDPRLLALAQQMGGTPVEIWEDREYWGETNAMLYLRDRFPEDGLRCTLFHRIKRSVDLYAKGYAERFLEVARSAPASNRCRWQ